MSLEIRALDGTTKRLEADVLATFARGFAGRLLRAGDAGYDEARRVWNGMIDRRPALIVRPTGTADVARAVRFARDQRLLVSVKGGGHNIAGLAVCEAGLVIDLSPMRGVWVDPAARTARAQADHSPVGNRDAAFVLSIGAGWDAAKDDAKNIAWARDCWQAVRPFATGGVYLNFLTEEEGADRIEAAYGKQTLDRLATIKRKLDPQNLFRHTKSVLPVE